MVSIPAETDASPVVGSCKPLLDGFAVYPLRVAYGRLRRLSVESD
jgi:hypothetical protein